MSWRDCTTQETELIRRASGREKETSRNMWTGRYNTLWIPEEEHPAHNREVVPGKARLNVSPRVQLVKGESDGKIDSMDGG